MQTGLGAQGANGQRLNTVLLDECECRAREHFSGACQPSHDRHRSAPTSACATCDRLEMKEGGPALPSELWGPACDTVPQPTKPKYDDFGPRVWGWNDSDAQARYRALALVERARALWSAPERAHPSKLKRAHRPSGGGDRRAPGEACCAHGYIARRAPLTDGPAHDTCVGYQQHSALGFAAGPRVL